MERVKGVEPSSLAWEAKVMPLYDTRKDDRYCNQCRKFYPRSGSSAILFPLEVKNPTCLRTVPSIAIDRQRATRKGCSLGIPEGCTRRAWVGLRFAPPARHRRRILSPSSQRRAAGQRTGAK